MACCRASGVAECSQLSIKLFLRSSGGVVSLALSLSTRLLPRFVQKKEFKPSAALRKIYHSVERLVVRRKWLESDKLRLMTPRHQILDFPYSRRQAAGYPDEIHPQGVFYCNEIECASCQLKMISDVIRRTPLSSPSSWRWPHARISCASNFRCCRLPTSPARRCTHNPCAADVGQYLAVL
jgi:hypothetical protein